MNNESGLFSIVTPVQTPFLAFNSRTFEDLYIFIHFERNKMIFLI